MKKVKKWKLDMISRVNIENRSNENFLKMEKMKFKKGDNLNQN